MSFPVTYCDYENNDFLAIRMTIAILQAYEINSVLICLRFHT
jgi:hypothetical protein